MDLVKIEIQKLFASDKIQDLFTKSFREPSEIKNGISSLPEINFQPPMDIPHKIPNWNIKNRPHNLPAIKPCLLYTSPSPRDLSTSRMPSSA